jgi:hypothetical protein
MAVNFMAEEKKLDAYLQRIEKSFDGQGDTYFPSVLRRRHPADQAVCFHSVKQPS